MSKRGFPKTTQARLDEPKSATVPVVARHTAPVPSLPLNRPDSFLGPSVLIPAYMLLITIGYVIFHSGFATIRGNELSREQSLFTAVNAATLTGFQQARNVNDYTAMGQYCVLALTIIGIVFSFSAGGMAVVRIARMRYSDRQVFGWSFGAVGIVIVSRALSLLFLGHAAGLFNAIFQAVSAVGNSGLYIGRLPAANTPAACLVLLPLAVLGGLGLPVLMELTDRVRGKSALSEHSQTVLTWTAGCYVIATIILLFLRWPDAAASSDQWRGAFMSASRDAINARSAGFPFQFATNFPRTVQWAVIVLMVIGAAPAGTAGGIKVTTLGVLVRGIRNTFGGRIVGRLFAMALVWTIGYLIILLTALLVLVTTEPQISADRLFFLAASALGNVGLSHDPVTVSTPGLYTLSVVMLVGRIGSVLMLWWVVEKDTDAVVAVG